jgi:hypothetical protein
MDRELLARLTGLIFFSIKNSNNGQKPRGDVFDKLLPKPDDGSGSTLYMAVVSAKDLHDIENPREEYVVVSVIFLVTQSLTMFWLP